MCKGYNSKSLLVFEHLSNMNSCWFGNCCRYKGIYSIDLIQLRIMIIVVGGIYRISIFKIIMIIMNSKYHFIP